MKPPNDTVGPEGESVGRDPIDIGTELARRRASQGGSGEGPTNERLVRLETHFEYIQRDLGEIKSGMSLLNELPTKADLNSWKWQWGGMALAIIVLAITGIVGGLALINRSVEPPSTQPIIVQLPAITPSHGAANNH